MTSLTHIKVRLLPHHYFTVETVLSLLFVFVLMSGQVSAVTRFNNRSLLVNDGTPSATTIYTLTLDYNTQTSIGSLELLFCNDPIPDDPCDAPTGLDASSAQLASQAGESGYSITTRQPNELVLSRSPTVAGGEVSEYVFNNIVNPVASNGSFSIRLSDYASTDASGPAVDIGSVVSEVAPSIELATQVQPLLIFCLEQQVSDDCSTQSGGSNSDLGTLSPTSTLSATSQMSAGTNASRGYTITANGPTMSAGTGTIPALNSPTPSMPGTNQFGINLAANTNPAIGSNSDGDSTNTVVSSDYAIPNEFLYRNGDVVASAPNVSLVQRYTVSYIVNSAPNLAAGVYSTSITYICSGRF